MQGEWIAMHDEGVMVGDDRWVMLVVLSGDCEDMLLRQLGGRYSESREKERIRSCPE
jgi:hypothetical protein